MEVAFALVVVVLAGAMFASILKLREANARLAEALTASTSASGRLDELRKELGVARDDASKKAKALEEARAEAKKKARREGKKMQREEDTAADEGTSSGADSKEEVTRLKQAIAGLEAQIADLMRTADRGADEVRAELKNEYEQRLAAAREESAAIQKTLEELRESVRRKAEDRPEVPGSALDLKALPTDAVQELARYFRKAEEFERLYGVAQGRLQLAQERAQELQRRYYAVCRELALLTGGGQPATDEDARKAAESVVDKSDEVSASAAPSQGPSPQGAAAGEEGAKKKKRRRRRRKKKPTDGAQASEGAADGEEGADDGDEGDEDEGEGESHPETVSAAADVSASAEAGQQPVTEAAAKEPAAEEKQQPAAEAAAEEPAAAEPESSDESSARPTPEA